MGFQLAIPLGGLGSRFSTAGYGQPKPFLDLFGRAMLEVVIENLTYESTSSLLLVALREHSDLLDPLVEKLNNSTFLEESKSLEVVYLETLSEGPAHSIWLGREKLDANLPLIIANSDQFIEGGIGALYRHISENDEENAVLLLEDTDPKWSFARLNEEGYVSEIKEKQPISNHATAGVYGFSKASHFFEGFRKMQAAGDRTNGEFYVGPIFNYVTNRTKGLHLGLPGDKFHGLGIPEDFENFKKLYSGGIP